MTLVRSWGFDAVASLANEWDQVLGTSSISATAARNGVGGYLQGTSNGRIVANVTTSVTFTMGFAFNVQSSPGATEQVCAFLDGNTIQVDLRLDTAGHLIITRNGTVLGTSASAMTFGVWHYIEFKSTIDPSTGIAEAKVDGIFFLQLSGQNTRATTNSFIGAVQLGGQLSAGGRTWWFDDVYLNNASGAVNTTYLGDIRVQTVLPTANGTTNNFTAFAATWAANSATTVNTQITDSNGNIQRATANTGDTKTGGSAPAWSTTLNATTTDNHVTWTLIAKTPLANWMYVDEPTPDDVSSYVSSTNIGDIDRYTYPAVTATQIFAVVVKLRAAKDNAGTRSIRADVKSGATTTDSGSDIPLTQNVFATLLGIFETDPNTAAAWLQANVNAAEFGVKLTA